MSHELESVDGLADMIQVRSNEVTTHLLTTEEKNDYGQTLEKTALSLLKTNPELERKIQRKNMNRDKAHRTGNRQKKDFSLN